MHKNLKRIISLSVCILMVFSMLISCKNKPKTVNTSSNGDSSASETVQSDSGVSSQNSSTAGSNTNSTASIASQTSKPNINIGGNTSKIDVKQTGFGVSSSMYNSIKGSKVQVVLFNEPTEAEKKMKADFEKKYQCTVEFKVYGWAEWQTKIYQMVTSGNPPDTLILNDAFFLSYVAKNVVQDITKYVDLRDTVWNTSVTSAFMWNGKLYGVAKQNEDYIFYIYYNKNMFDDYAVKTPNQLYDAGQWNYSKFKEVAAKFVKDTNKDGISDQRGFATWYWDIFILGNGGNEIKINKDKIDLTLKNSNELEGLKLIQEMQLRDKSFDQGQPNWREDFMAGKVAMIAERPWQAVGEMNMYSKCKFQIGVAPFPKGPNTPNNTAPGMIYSWGVPRGAKNPLGAVAWYHYGAVWGSENKNDPSLKAAVMRSYKDDATRNFIENYNNTHSVNGTLIYGLPNWWDKRWDFWKDILCNDVAPANAVDKNKAVFQSGIDTVMTAMNKK